MSGFNKFIVLEKKKLWMDPWYAYKLYDHCTGWGGEVGVAATMEHTQEELHANQGKEHHHRQCHDTQVEQGGYWTCQRLQNQPYTYDEGKIWSLQYDIYL